MSKMFESLLLLKDTSLPWQVDPNLVGSAIVPVLKVLSMCVIGALLAIPRVGVMNHEACKILSKLVFALFLPCLIFEDLGKSVTVRQMAQWWFIPINVILSCFIGCIFGVIVALICRPPPQFFRLTVVLTGIGNSGNIPLAMVTSICHGWKDNAGICTQNGVAYVSFGQWVAVIIVYTFVFHMLEPPRTYFELVTEEGVSIDEAEREDMMPPLLEAEWPAVRDAQTEATRQAFLFKVFREASFAAASFSSSFNSSFSNIIQRAEQGWFTEPRVIRKIRIVVERTPLKHILQPPILASILAIILGSIPATKNFIYIQDAPLGFITDTLGILGDAMVPCIMLVLGCMLSGGPGSSELGLRTIVGICFTRLVILPVVGFGIVYGAQKLGFLAEPGLMYRFVLMLQHSMPSSILSGAITTLRGFGEREASSVLFWQHVFSVFSIAAYTVLYFKVVDKYLI